MSRRRVVVFVALALAALVPAGCSTEQTNTASEPPVTASGPVATSAQEPGAGTTDPAAASVRARSARDMSAVATSVAVAGAGSAEMATLAEPPTRATTGAAPRRCADESVDLGVRTITVWHTLGVGRAAERVLSDHVARFGAGHPGVTVDLVPWASAQELSNALGAAPPGDRPDVVLGARSAVRRLYDTGMFVTPAECTGGRTPPTLADLLPVVAHAYSVDGVLRAAPYGVSAPVMMFDRARWRAAGVDPDDPPATWDELFDTIIALRDSGRARFGAVLYDASAAWLVSHTAAQEGRVLVAPNNGYDGTAVASVTFESDRVVGLLRRFSQLHVEGYVHWAGLNEGGNDDLVLMVSGDDSAGLTFHTSASLGDVFDVLGGSDQFDGVDVGVAAMPGPRVSPPGGNAWWLTDRGDPDQAAAAWALVEYLTAPAQVAELAAATGYAPTSVGAAEQPVVQQAWAARPPLRVAYDLLAATPGDPAHAGPQVGPASEFFREVEYAAAWPIDAQDDPVARLQMHAGTALGHLLEYHTLVTAAR